MAHRHEMPSVRLWMALGATIDFEAGNIKRAPIWMRRLALEWLYRIIQEPKRMARRYLVDDPVFSGTSCGSSGGNTATLLPAGYDLTSAGGFGGVDGGGDAAEYGVDIALTVDAAVFPSFM